MADDEGAGVTPVQLFEQLSHGLLLRLGARVGGLTADVKPALVADADGVGVMVQAVCPDQKLGPTRFHLSVTTDDVVVADAELEAPLAVPCVDLSGGALLVRAHGRTVYYYQCNCSHFQLCIKHYELSIITALYKDGTTNGCQDRDDDLNDLFPKLFLHSNIIKMSNEK